MGSDRWIQRSEKGPAEKKKNKRYMRLCRPGQLHREGSRSVVRSIGVRYQGIDGEELNKMGKGVDVWLRRIRTATTKEPTCSAKVEQE